MLRKQLLALAPVLLAVGLIGTGCDKAKDAAQEALGFKPVSDEDSAKIRVDAGWDDNDPKLANFEVVKNGAFELTDKFGGDLSKKYELGPLPIEIPDKGTDAAGNQKSMMLLRAETFEVADKKYTRFRIISVAKFDGESKKIVIEGDKFNEFTDPDDRISLEKKNQSGQYLLVQGKGEKGIAYLTGVVQLKKDGATDAEMVPVPKTLVFTTSSPFVTRTGKDGKYLLAMLEGSKGTTIAYHKNIASELSATGTPDTASKEIAYAGVLDQYKGDVEAKTGSLGPENATKASATFDKINGKVTDFVNGWTLIVSDLMFIQPKQAPPAEVKIPDADQPVAAPPPKVEPIAASTNPISRKDEATPAIYNVDLGCSGSNDGKKLDLVRDGTKFDDYTNAPGWRATGDVRIAFDSAPTIFPDIADERYLDATEGYCLLATGNAQYNMASKDAAYMPGPNGLGQTSEMWQKVVVPAAALSIQARVAFFSQEFPQYVGSKYNDSFFIKFDESIDVIASGSLNDLAGINSADAAVKDSVTKCKDLASETDKTGTCGDWSFTANTAGMSNGDLWNINSSDQGPKQANKFCNATDASMRCYHGMIGARMICKDLTADDQGKERTLRVNVSDAGDSYFDSALAVDSIAFSTKACGDTEGRMTQEEDSRALDLK